MASLAVLTALCDAITTAHTEFADLVDTLTTQLKPTASKMKKKKNNNDIIVNNITKLSAGSVQLKGEI